MQRKKTCCGSIFFWRMSRPSPAFARRPASPTMSSHGPRRRTVSSPFDPLIGSPWTSASVHWPPPRAGHRMIIAPSGRSYGGALLPQRYACLLGGSLQTRLLPGQISSLAILRFLTYALYVDWNGRTCSTLSAGALWQRSCGMLWPWIGASPRWRTS